MLEPMPEPISARHRHPAVPPRSLLLATAVLLVVACQPAPTAPPATTSASGLEALVADLKSRGATAEIGGTFAGEPIGGQGTTVCVGAETLNVYEFIDEQAALAASAKINRQDPSNVGTGIVEWIGPPRFWLRDRIIVLYLGADAATDSALRVLLGQPFAESREPGRGLMPRPPCR